MPSLEELLRGALAGANDGFAKADQDLKDNVASVADAVKKATGFEAKVSLETVRESVEGTTYALMVGIDGLLGKSDVGGYRVTRSGYPIASGQLVVRSSNFTMSRELDDQRIGWIRNAHELQEHFGVLVSSAESPLVLLLSFVMRQVAKKGKPS